ncbi:hypothetical protein BST10_19780 [Mycolicibacter algericus DSM 45454]|uniref:Uncharacterized protein n=2 Tax=Mycolicibacter algericus TaxID=1288388 RepID=A0A7I9YE31_MYCAL|nr:hypothetical protein BST10_19780 [Mycolicibacter algericus DSM 45454]GFG86959.1 hypothetical protein MALGJ_36350 [Mycolicibacter algericus]
MTLLGGAVYAGFFTLAALWLVATNPDNVEEQTHPNAHPNAKRQDRSNSASTAAAPVGSSPCCASQSSLK